uniref:Uncharacterized protein n=1 Tax=Sinocyclocheilus anshuiensis TaxID=1608454 RepID=A0A671N114_9TELE
MLRHKVTLCYFTVYGYTPYYIYCTVQKRLVCSPTKNRFKFVVHNGYVQVNWKKVEKDVKLYLINPLVFQATEFVKKNSVVSSGFLLGLASRVKTCFL